MFRTLLAMWHARRARARAEQWAEHVRRVEAARLAEFPDSAGYSWGVQVVCQGRALPRRRLLRPTPRRRRQRRPVEPEEEPEPDDWLVRAQGQRRTRTTDDGRRTTDDGRRTTDDGRRRTTDDDGRRRL